MTTTTPENREETIKVREISYDGLMPWEDVHIVSGKLSRVTVWREERAGRFPRRVQITPGRVAWIGPEIKKHVETRPRVNLAPEIENGEAIAL